MSDRTIHLGRDTALTRRHWDAIAPHLTVPPAHLFRGTPRPAVSPEIWRTLDWMRYAGQLIGDCTGEAGAHAASGATGASISPLHLYWHGRRECARRGIALGPEGCIVSLVALAAESSGFARYADYPATDAAYRAYRDDTPPPSAAESSGRAHLLLRALSLTSFEAMLDWQGQDVGVWVGRPVFAGMQSTRPDDGYYRNAGGLMGGHSTEFCGYDLTRNRQYEINSWDNVGWGWRASDRGMDPRKGGRSGIGWTDLDSVAAQFTPAAFASGEVEAIVLLEATRYESLLDLAGAVAL